MYSKKDILEIAKKQLCLDYNCQYSDFEKDSNTLTENKSLEGSRSYTEEDCFFKMISIGGRVIISADNKMKPWLEEKILGLNPNWMFDFSVLRVIDNKLREFGHEIDEMPHFYLPKMEKLHDKKEMEVKWFEQSDILQFRDDRRFEQAFIFDEDSPDMLGVAALSGNEIMGMAGASADSEHLFQVGIDVIPEYSGQGIASTLVYMLKEELLKRGKIPFYGTAISHTKSMNVAVNAGFYPAWSEVYSRKIEQD